VWTVTHRTEPFARLHVEPRAPVGVTVVDKRLVIADPADRDQIAIEAKVDDNRANRLDKDPLVPSCCAKEAQIHTMPAEKAVDVI